MFCKNSPFYRGLLDGLPICLGYLSVSFTFGLFAVGQGLSIWEALLVSAFNITSAGQLAGVPLMIAAAPLYEMALTQLIINLRYALMSVSFSQKLSNDVRTADRFLISFVNTDEVFAVVASKKGTVGCMYLYGLILTPYLGWTFGTLCGAIAGDLLPSVLNNALGIAIYGMFFSIFLPAARDSRPTLAAILLSAAMSCAIYYVPSLSGISSGFSIIICAVISSAVLALLRPVPAPKNEETEKIT